MKILPIGQHITFLFRNRPRDGTVIEYERQGCNSKYKVLSAYGECWIRRKKIVEVKKYTAPTDPVCFIIELV